MEIGGIDADFIIQQLMQLEERPLQRLEQRQEQAQTASDAIGKLKSQVDAFGLKAAKLAGIAAFDRHQATVSDPAVASASVTGTAYPGSLSFTVDQLASAHGLRSIGTVASGSVAVTSDAVLAVASGTRAHGIGTVRAGAGLGEGDVSVSVIQASSAASTTGSAALASSTAIDGTNDTIDVTVNGVARTLTIAAGTYDQAGLAAAVQDAADAAGGGLDVTLDNAGIIEIATRREGSAAALQVTGGTALGALNLATDATARTGADAVIDVDGTTTTVTLAEDGAAVAVDTGAGTLDLTLSGGLRVGDVDVAVVSTGDRSLAGVAAAISGAGNGVSAAAVKVDDGIWRLQLGATTTGEQGNIAIDGAVFDEIGGMVESSAAQDAVITIGSGAGAYSVEASGNRFDDVVPGVTITAQAVSATPVDVTVTRDDEALAREVSDMVSAANTLLGEIKVQTRYDTSTNSGGPLVGNATVRQLANQVRDALGGQVSGLDTSLPSQVGIEVQRDGSFTFDKSKFLAAIEEDPDAVARLFSRGGAGTGSVTFATSTDDTVPGTYDVDVTTAATRASSGPLFVGGAASATRVGVRIGSVTALVDVSAGQSEQQIADDLNAALAESGLEIVAEVDTGGGVVIRADDWGSAGDFELNTDVLGAGTWDAQVGVDVEGTIDGVLATGTGRRLALSANADSTAAGLAVDVDGGVTGAVGTVEYVPGVAARVAHVASSLTRVDTGALTTAQDAADRRIDRFNDQIERFEDRLVRREAALRQKWSRMQSLMGELQGQGDWLAGQLGSLSSNWGP